MFSLAEPVADYDLTELLVTRKELVEGSQPMQSARFERSAHVFVDKRPKPIPERTRLPGNGVEFTGDSALLEIVQHVVGYQSSLLEPREKVVPGG